VWSRFIKSSENKSNVKNFPNVNALLFPVHGLSENIANYRITGQHLDACGVNLSCFIRSVQKLRKWKTQPQVLQLISKTRREAPTCKEKRLQLCKSRTTTKWKRQESAYLLAVTK
jgi:hypothetical protein